MDARSTSFLHQRHASPGMEGIVRQSKNNNKRNMTNYFVEFRV